MTGTVFDVAEYILRKIGRKVSTWRLQKLVYYSQAWHLVWDDEPLFAEDIQAWANGPVCAALYQRHKGEYNIDTVGGDPERLTDAQRESIDLVLESYGDFTGQQISDLTHMESPWLNARKGVDPRERGEHVISLESMAEFYESLPP